MKRFGSSRRIASTRTFTTCAYFSGATFGGSLKRLKLSASFGMPFQRFAKYAQCRAHTRCASGSAKRSRSSCGRATVYPGQRCMHTCTCTPHFRPSAIARSMYATTDSSIFSQSPSTIQNR